MKEKEFLQQEPGGKRSLYLVICVLSFLQETGDQNTNKWEKIFPSSLQASVPNIPQPVCEVLMDLGYMDMQKKKKNCGPADVCQDSSDQVCVIPL